jgi:hypothetical protein
MERGALPRHNLNGEKNCELAAIQAKHNQSPPLGDLGGKKKTALPAASFKNIV